MAQRSGPEHETCIDGSITIEGLEHLRDECGDSEEADTEYEARVALAIAKLRRSRR